MPNRKRKPPAQDEDMNQAAARIVAQASGQPMPRSPEVEKPRKKNPAAVALGRLGGAKGGKARAAALSPKRRAAIAKKAAAARWRKKRQ